MVSCPSVQLSRIWVVLHPLHRMLFSSRRYSTNIPLMTLQHGLLHLTWAKEHYCWAVENWRRIAWPDKSYSQLFWRDSRVRGRRRLYSVMDPSYQQCVGKVGDGSLMMWVFFVGICMVIIKSVLAHTDLVINHLYHMCLPYFLVFMFQQDNEGFSCAHMTLTWLQEYLTPTLARLKFHWPRMGQIANLTKLSPKSHPISKIQL